MRKKSRLFLSMASMVLTVALFCFGVYAALGVSYTISGSVVYQVKDVFVNIETSLYVSKSESLTEQGELDDNVALFEANQSDVMAQTNTEKLAYSDGLSTYNPDTGEITNSGEAVSKTSENIPINYGSYEAGAKGYAYYIVVSITNYGTESVSVTLTNNINNEQTNSLTKLSQNTTIEGRTADKTYTTEHIVIGMALNDATKSVSDVNFNVPILIERELPPEPTLDKLYFSLINGGTEYEVVRKGGQVYGEVVIPSTYNGKPVTSIGASAFYGCSSLTEITIPDSVTSIGRSAFQNCRSLTEITIPEGVTSIGNQAFQYCSSLTEITIPSSVISIGSYAFDGCKFTTVNYEASEEGYTFNNGTLTILSMKDLPAWRSANINELVLEVVWGIQPTSIGYWAFQNCRSLTEITIPSSVTSIGSIAFENCKFTTVNYTTSGEGYTFENGTLTISSMTNSPAWYSANINPLVTSVVWNCRPTSIGDYAFSGCSSLTDITIPDSVKSIGYDSFYNCSSLTQITIPDSVKSIESSAFSGCSSLQTVYVEATTPASMYGYNQFNSCHANLKIYVPAGCGETYKTATGWSTWASKIVEMAN